MNYDRVGCDLSHIQYEKICLLPKADVSILRREYKMPTKDSLVHKESIGNTDIKIYVWQVPNKDYYTSQAYISIHTGNDVKEKSIFPDEKFYETEDEAKDAVLSKARSSLHTA